MWSITLKLMRKTKRMLIPAGIAIMIGTAFIASTFLFGNAMNDSLTRQMTAMFGNANYAVTVNSSDLSDEELNEAYSSTVGDFHLDQIAGIEGVDGVRASVETGVSVSRGDSAISGEIMSFTRSGDTFTVTRAQDNTEAKAHDADDTIQLVGEFASAEIQDVIYTLLTDYAGIDTAYIDKPAWDTERDTYLTGVWNLTQPEPVGVLVMEEPVGTANVTVTAPPAGTSFGPWLATPTV